MREILTISSRGQITLPAALRNQLGIKAGGVVIAEEEQGKIILRPAMVMEIETYTDKDIALWDAEDGLSAKDREIILNRFQDKS